MSCVSLVYNCALVLGPLLTCMSTASIVQSKTLTMSKFSNCSVENECQVLHPPLSLSLSLSLPLSHAGMCHPLSDHASRNEGMRKVAALSTMPDRYTVMCSITCRPATMRLRALPKRQQRVLFAPSDNEARCQFSAKSSKEDNA
jgi:hypothetical protein